MTISSALGAIATKTDEGRALSPLNSCLILTQFPTSSMVGGFLQWKDHGRSVKKGAVGISIWVPTGRKKEQAELKEISESKEKPGGFIMGTIFDITQTEVSKGPDWRDPRKTLPELIVDRRPRDELWFGYRHPVETLSKPGVASSAIDE